MMMCGGFTELRDADDKCKEVANSVKDKVEEQLNQKFTVYEPIKFATQVVAGANYMIKIKVDDNKYIHIKVFVPLPHTKKPNQLSKCEGGKTLEDALKP